MTTESKKLQTSLAPNRFNPAKPLIVGMDDEVDHDARIAHSLMDASRKTPETPLEADMLEVIRKLMDCILRRGYSCMVMEPGPHCDCVGCQSRAALNAAKPYLEDCYTPNTETLASMQELERGGKRLGSVADLMADLNDEVED